MAAPTWLRLCSSSTESGKEDRYADGDQGNPEPGQNIGKLKGIGVSNLIVCGPVKNCASAPSHNETHSGGYSV